MLTVVGVLVYVRPDPRHPCLRTICLSQKLAQKSRGKLVDFVPIHYHLPLEFVPYSTALSIYCLANAFRLAVLLRFAAVHLLHKTAVFSVEESSFSIEES